MKGRTPLATLLLYPCGVAIAALLATVTVSSARRAEGVALDLVARGFEDPVYVTGDPSRPDHIFVVEQPGRIQLLSRGAPMTPAFLDIEKLVGSGGERGLLSMALHPKWPKRRFVYVNYTNTAGDTVIERYTTNRKLTRARRRTRKVFLTVVQPFANHNGGQIQFGPDGYLYIGMGDGGDAGDPLGAGQDLTTLLGKMLRVEMRRNRMRIPADNPMLPGVGRTAIWALGLRNPWRFSFDRETGDLLIADVGHNAREEINFEAAGGPGGVNYGWAAREGSRPFDLTVVPATTPLQDPIHEYDHSVGRSITGGYVYRGAAIPDLFGDYVFADFAASRIWALRVRNGRASRLTELSASLRTTTGRTPTVSSLGEDAAGELYVCDYFAGAVYRIIATGSRGRD